MVVIRNDVHVALEWAAAVAPFSCIEKGIISYHDRLRLYLAGGAAFCCKTTTGPNSMLDSFACVCLFRSVLDPFLAMSQ